MVLSVYVLTGYNGGLTQSRAPATLLDYHFTSVRLWINANKNSNASNRRFRQKTISVVLTS